MSVIDQDNLLQAWKSLVASQPTEATGQADAGMSIPTGSTLLSSYQTQALQVMVASPWSLRHWQMDPYCLQPQWFEQAYTKPQMAQELAAALVTVTNEETLAKQLRSFRKRHQLRLIWRNCLKLASAQAITQEVTHMADVCIDAALGWLYTDATRRFGIPMGQDSGEPQQLVVLGMGKLGGGELNLSSDIDLIFAFAEAGETQGGRKPLDNQQFFVRLGQSLVKALDQHTGDGFVFRVDMRLRPYGSAGALALNFNAMELYYQDQGREWERYAFIKARAVAGDTTSGAELLQTLQPFVYRRYMDFSAIEALRSLKQMITSEVRRRGLDNNVKLGTGGIREVEFIAQAFQLIYGGKDKRLRTTSLIQALDCLSELANWSAEDITSLKQDYWFLRDVEHALQAIEDKQTQELPTAPLEQARMAAALKYASWQLLADDIQGARERIHSQFSAVVAEEADAPTAAHANLVRMCQALSQVSGGHAQVDETLWLDVLIDMGFADGDAVFKHLLALYQSRAALHMQALAHERLAKVLPTLLQLVSDQDNSSETLARVLVLIEAVLRRSVYLVLLQENPNTMRLLVTLCAASPWFGDFLARQPALLDELLDANSLFSQPTLIALQGQLRQRLLRVPEEDTEQIMEGLRHFKHANALRVAAQEVTGNLTLMEASDQLTYTAEALLQHVLHQCWQEMQEKFGEACDVGGKPYEFIIVGYGKVGGWELSYGSDLDLVFIYDAPLDAETKVTADNQKSLPVSVFFTRLGQRIINYLNTATVSGQLYEVDMRLRPDGAKGLLVSSINAFTQYQQQQAWTWEHQALVRARPVAASNSMNSVLVTKFFDVRHQVLSQVRDQADLLKQVVSMREKMRANLSSSSPTNKSATTRVRTNANVVLSAGRNGSTTLEEETSVFHIKQDQGGLVDIEFMVQYAVLANAHKHPKLTRYSDNIRILDSLEDETLIEPDDAQTLRHCYRALRAVEHRQTLQNLSVRVAAAPLQTERERVQVLWQKLMK